MINQTAKKILKALSFDGVEVEAFRHMADLKRLDPMKIFYKKIDEKIYNGSHAVPIRIFFPTEKSFRESEEKKHNIQDKKMLLFIHGGGWVTESIDNYERKGWFGYTLCVPKYPEVSEAVDGSSMIRIKPLSDECREVSKRCVYLLGYQGNNLLCSDWDRSDMEGLDYNGLYEYLYRMKYGERYEFSGNSSGIPAEEFENLIMEFLPITAEQIKKWAVFDSEHQTYDWERLGCLNYSPTYFGTSLPEVVEIRDIGEGNNVLVVDAVCDTFICNDTVITSELTVKFNDDKSFKYMGNKILNNGTKEVPKYQYRIKRKN